MSWPQSQDYNEAVQTPATNFADPDLKHGQTVTSTLGLPMPYSGNLADVYQVRCPEGDRWAVKCFTREVPGRHDRFEAISRHLRQANLPFTVDFTYLEKGILVAGQWYPVLKMEWVEGLTLNQFVAQNLDKPATLETLLLAWGRMGQRLRAAELAHADLQHGNVLLVPAAAGNNSLALKLVDYDGMWVPALAGNKSGEVGHPAYQHPRRGREGTYSLDVDRFPMLLVATVLHALKTEGRELWEKYDNGDNLLFTETDLRAPTKSHLFLNLLRSTDALTVTLATRMIDALRGEADASSLLEGVLAEAPQRVSSPPAAKRSDVSVATAIPTEVDWKTFDGPLSGLMDTLAQGTTGRIEPGGLPVFGPAAGVAGSTLLAVGGNHGATWGYEFPERMIARQSCPDDPAGPVDAGGPDAISAEAASVIPLEAQAAAATPAPGLSH